MPQLVWVTRPDGYHEWYNRRWYEYTGTTPEQMEGWGWQSVHDPAELPRVLEGWRKSIATGRPFEMEFPLRGADGRFRWFLTRVEPLRDERGKIVRWFGTNTDVQARREAAAERERLVRQLDLERRRLADVFMQAPVAVAVARGTEARDLIFELVNPQYEELIPPGRDPLGRRLRDVLPEMDEDLYQALQNVLDTGEPFVAVDHPASLDRDNDGTPETYYFSLVYHPLVEADGMVSGVVCVGVEVTESVEARLQAEELRRTAESARADAEAARMQAETANRAKSEFLATMSHEVRTPINAQIGYAQLLEMGLAGPLTDQQRTFLGKLRSSSQHLLAILSEVLDLAKAEAGRLPMARAHAMTGDASAAALALVLPEAESKGVRVIDAGREARGVPYVGDENRVRQIVVNLMSNAVKFTPAGGSVQVSVVRSTLGVCIAVEDSGAGIDPQDLPFIFQRFWQANPGEGHGGLGLGLALTRHLVELHGGRVSAKSDGPGRGARFEVELNAAELLTEVAGA